MVALDLASHTYTRLPYDEDARVSPQEWQTLIAARQAAVAERMLG